MLAATTGRVEPERRLALNVPTCGISRYTCPIFSNLFKEDLKIETGSPRHALPHVMIFLVPVRLVYVSGDVLVLAADNERHRARGKSRVGVPRHAVGQV